jgi:hypothetical protein
MSKEYKRHAERRVGRGYQAIFVPWSLSAVPATGPMDGQPIAYLYTAALEVNVLNCRVEVRRALRSGAPSGSPGTRPCGPPAAI